MHKARRALRGDCRDAPSEPRFPGPSCWLATRRRPRHSGSGWNGSTSWIHSIALLEKDEVSRAVPGRGRASSPGFITLPSCRSMPVATRSRWRGRPRPPVRKMVEGTPVIALRRSGERVIAVETPGRSSTRTASFLATGHGLLLDTWESRFLQPVRVNSSALLPPELSRARSSSPPAYLAKADGTLLVGATQQPGRHDHTVEEPHRLPNCKFAFSVLPSLRLARFVTAQSGLRPTLPDRLPAIGPIKPRGLFISLWDTTRNAASCSRVGQPSGWHGRCWAGECILTEFLPRACLAVKSSTGGTLRFGLVLSRSSSSTPRLAALIPPLRRHAFAWCPARDSNPRPSA